MQEPLGVARRVLDPGDGQVAQQPHRDAGGCDLRVVVREDGRTGCRLCHRVVVRTRISHSRRRQREHGVGATVDGVARERGGLPGGGRAGSRDHGHGPGHSGADGFEQGDSLGGLERGRLARGARHHHGAHPDVDELCRQCGAGRCVELALVVEQRDERDAHTGEDRGGHAPQATGRRRCPARGRSGAP